MSARLEVDGLEETEVAFDRIARGIEDELDKRLGIGMRRLHREGRARLMRREGAGRARYKRQPELLDLDSSLLRSTHEIVLRPGGTMIGAEMGAYRAWVFGRVTNTMKLKPSLSQFPLWRGEDSGKIVGPMFKPRSKEVTKQTRALDNDTDRWVSATLRRSGVPR